MSLWCVMTELLGALDSSSDVSDQRSVGSSPDRGTCVHEQVTLSVSLCPFDGIKP